eukprot:scaffold2944_cov302-Prasinococcus_capsulatus_cf.AAC.2
MALRVPVLTSARVLRRASAVSSSGTPAAAATRRLSTTAAHLAVPSSASLVANRRYVPRVLTGLASHTKLTCAARCVVLSGPNSPDQRSSQLRLAAAMLDYEAVDADGKTVNLSQYAGKVVMVVNVASK